MNKELDPNKAKQGRSGWQVLVILVAAIVLLMIGWWFVEIYGQAIDPDSSEQVGGAPAEQSGEEAPPPAE